MTEAGFNEAQIAQIALIVQQALASAHHTEAQNATTEHGVHAGKTVIKTKKSIKALKEIRQLRTYTKVKNQQDLKNFIQFSDEIEDFFECAGVTAENRKALLKDENVALSEDLDNALKLILVQNVEESLRKKIKTLVPANVSATALVDWRNLNKLFDVNQVSQAVFLVCNLLSIMNKRGTLDFQDGLDRFLRILSRVSELIAKMNDDDKQKVGVGVFASSYPQLAETLNMQLSLADKQSYPTLVHTLNRLL